MKKENTNVSVVVPTYNGKSLLEKHLPAVFSCMRDGDELIIIDDASTDNSVNMIIKKYDLKKNNSSASTNFVSYIGTIKFDSKGRESAKTIGLVLLVNKTNQRFGESCNRAVMESSHPFIFLINNDVSPHVGSIHSLLSYFNNQDVFAVGCKELETDSTVGGKNVLWFEKGLFTHSRAKNFESGPTAWASGGSSLFSKEKWEILGGFDSSYYPAYWEDIDLSFRARKKGWKILFSSEAVVDHQHESTNIDAFGKIEMKKISWKNSDTFAWKNGTLFQKILFLLWKPYWIVKRNKSL